MPDVSSDHLPGNEAGHLVAPRAMERMAVVATFYYSSAFCDVHHPLLERVAPGMAENKAGGIRGFVVVRDFWSGFIPRGFADDCGWSDCGFGQGDGRELSHGKSELSGLLFISF